MCAAQDAEYFESKKSRRGGRGGNGGAGLGHNGAARGRPAAQQRQQAVELDADDAAAVTDAEITALGGGETCSAALQQLHEIDLPCRHGSSMQRMLGQCPIPADTSTDLLAAYTTRCYGCDGQQLY